MGIPASLGALTVLYFVLGVPLAVIAPLSLLVPAAYVGTAWYVVRALPAFETRFNALLVRADVDGLWRHYRDARALRLFAPQWIMLSKLGLILCLRGQFRAASSVLDEAYLLSPRRRRADLLGPLARAKFETGDFDDLREIALQWRVRSPFPGAANLYLAAAYLADPREDAAQARPLLDEVDVGLTAEERRLRARLIAELDARG